MKKVRFGVVGLGGMGSAHCHYLPKMSDAQITAVCDIDKAKADEWSKKLGVPGYPDHKKLLERDDVDAVLIAVPHYDHPVIAIDAFKAGKHVLTEKPITVSIKQARLLVKEAKKYPKLKFGIMFQQRTEPPHIKMREMVRSGELGELTRVSWLITDWFRSNAYYASGGWRATWTGEGGGVLINQCPHNLDLMWWITGLTPRRITAVGAVGKTHPIEVEDEVSAVIEYTNGAVGHFVTTTGEAPGTNRLEIVGNRGKMVLEGGKLMFHRTRVDVKTFRETTQDRFPSIETWVSELKGPGRWGEAHQQVTEAFVRAIRENKPMIADGVEGVYGLELGNAMQMAALTGEPVDCPVDGEAYEAFLKAMAKKYGGRKKLKTRKGPQKDDLGTSWK